MLLDILISALGELIGSTTGASLQDLLADRRLRRDLDAAIARAEARFRREYRAVDPDLAAALPADQGLARSPAVRAALHELLSRPHISPEERAAALQRSFADLLPAEVERGRVDAAVGTLLRYLLDEALTLPQLQPLYVALMHRQAAERLARGGGGPDAAPAVADPARPAALPPPGPRHNLPRPDYRSFVGRADDLAWITGQLDDPGGPQVLALVGVGGLGKSALAIAAGHRACEAYARLSPERRFEAIVWASAKETDLTIDGAAPTAPSGLIFRTLTDIYLAISEVLTLPAIRGAARDEQDRLIQQALASRRTLLIIDNFESVADGQVAAFLRNLPSGTRAIVTSRVSLGTLGRSRELEVLSEADARALLAAEAERLGLELSAAQAARLLALVGGMPLAVKLSLARLADGEPLAATLRWLEDATGDLPAYCVAGQAARVEQADRAAWHLLLATALFEQRAGASPAALGPIGAAGEAARDAGLYRLRRLGLVSQSRDGRVWMLPIVQRYALAALERDPEGGRLRQRWLGWALELAQTRGKTADLQIDQVGEVLVEYPALRLAIDWCRREGRHAELLALVEGSWFLAELLGRFDEIVAMARAAHRAARALGSLRGRALALRQLAWVRRIREQPVARTEALLLRAELLARRAGDTALLADIWYVLADTRSLQGDLAGAARYATLMVEQAEEGGDERVRALGAYRMAKVALRRDGPEAALGWLDVAEHAARALGWRRQIAWTIYRRGVTLTAAARYAEAEAALQESLRLAQAWGEERFIAYTLHRLVAVYARAGQYELARRTAGQVGAHFIRLGIPRGEFRELEQHLMLLKLLDGDVDGGAAAPNYART